MPAPQGKLVAVEDLMQKLGEAKADRDGHGNFCIHGADGMIFGIGGDECIVTDKLTYSVEGAEKLLIDLFADVTPSVVIF